MELHHYVVPIFVKKTQETGSGNYEITRNWKWDT